MVKKAGFSLIELIVVIGLLALLTLAISSILLTSVMTSNRIRTTTKVKQAGNYALGQIQILVRNAKSLESCDQSSARLSLINPDGGTTQISTLQDALGVTRLASGSAYLTPSNIVVTQFSLSCEPAIAPNLVKISFDLKDTAETREVQNPELHFETSINLRNEP